MKKLILNIIIISVIFTNNAHAYIDPFTGGFILQALAGLFAAIVFWLGYPVRLIKKIFAKLFRPIETDNNHKNNGKK